MFSHQIQIVFTCASYESFSHFMVPHRIQWVRTCYLTSYRHSLHVPHIISAIITWCVTGYRESSHTCLTEYGSVSPSSLPTLLIYTNYVLHLIPSHRVTRTTSHPIQRVSHLDFRSFPMFCTVPQSRNLCCFTTTGKYTF
jgi:hypothetical protein